MGGHKNSHQQDTCSHTQEFLTILHSGSQCNERGEGEERDLDDQFLGRGGCKHGQVDNLWFLHTFKWKWFKTIY